MNHLVFIAALFCFLTVAQCSKEQIENVVTMFFNTTNTHDCKRFSLLFEENVWIEDPKGAEPVKTRKQLYDLCMQDTPFVAKKLSPALHQLHVSSNGAACPWTFYAAFANGCVVEFSGIDVFEFSNRILISKMIGYFDKQDVADQFAICMK
ncbi:hypothetical protein GEMRC1_007199 [Eukaryota sp. GEM-RC1]